MNTIIDWEKKDWNSIDHQGQRSYDFFNRFFCALLSVLPSGFNIVYRAWQDPKQPIDMSNIGEKTILLLWGERATKHPPIWTEIPALTLKPFCPASWVSSKIIPFPNEYFYDKSCQELGTTKTSEREIDVFFSGNLNRRRLDLFRGLTGSFSHYPRIPACYPNNGIDPLLQKIESSFIHRLLAKSKNKISLPPGVKGSIQFTKSFGSGFTWPKYWEQLLNSKILLCPPGFMSNETIRHVEGCKAGCIVVSGDLPPFQFYKNAPFVYVKDWRNITKVIQNILALPSQELNELGQKHLTHYQQCFAPEKLADYVIAALRQQG